MSAQRFVHLHLHTQYSLLDGACRVDRLMDQAEQMGFDSLAITDHGNMYGAINFYEKAQAKGIKPIIGCEVYVAYGSRFERPSGRGSQGAYNHLVLLAKDVKGYDNLSKIVSKGHLEGFYYKPRVDYELLAQHSEGIVACSGCLKGAVAQAVVHNDGQIEEALRMAGKHQDIFGKENYFLELQDHQIDEQHIANRGIIEISKKMGIPLIASNDVHYLTRDAAPAHEVMLCIQTGTVMSDPKRMRYGPQEFYMKSTNEMLEVFTDHPEAIDNTRLVSDMCNLEIDFGNLHFPAYDVPEGYDPKSYLVKLCADGIKTFYGVDDVRQPKNDDEKVVCERFWMELGVIEKTGFINYFLVVWDFINYARENGIPVGPGRGSGAGSIMAYALGITAIDPLRYELIFERFLNPERVSAPDFDIDFCQARRGEVIEYVKRKYGRENCAQIITFGSLGAKTVIRDVGRALEVPFGECDRLSKMVPEDPKMNLTKALEQNPELRKEYDNNNLSKRIIDYGFKLEGLSRNTGTHAAGVVIGEKPLIELIPLGRDKEGELITQYTMEPLEKIGLLKMDFLGLKTLTVIKEACDLIKELHDVDIDPEKIPIEDEKTYELLRRGDTVGVFQLESGGMRDLIRRVDVTQIEHLIAMIALYRPGPMNMLDDYVDRKTGKAKVEYDHPLLEPILKETYGVMIYQEQVQKAANVLAGFSLGQGDMLRRAMGKKKLDVMAQQRAIFVKGCKDTNNIDAAHAGKIFDRLEEFASYGFNKSHSAAYGMVSYQTAYLKAHYPEEFMSALLSSEIGNAEKLVVFISEVREMGFNVLPPDVNHSHVRFRPEGENTMRFGLAGVKNVGTLAMESLVVDRAANGPYAGLIDFCQRLDGKTVNKKVIENLARCGGFDSTGLDRARVFEGVEFAMQRAAASHRDSAAGQSSLFDLMGDADEAEVTTEEDLPDDAAPWPESEQLSAEKDLLGLYMSGHPLTKHATLLQRYRMHSTATIGEAEDGDLTRLGGIITSCIQRFTKAKQEPMAVLQVEDLEGSLEVTVFPEAYRNFQEMLIVDSPVMVCGEVSKREEPPRLHAREIYPLSDVVKHFTKYVSVRIPSARAENGFLGRIHDILNLHPGPVQVVLCVQFPGGEKVYLRAGKALYVLPSHDLLQELEGTLGEKSVHVSVSDQACLRPAPERKRWTKRD